MLQDLFKKNNTSYFTINKNENNYYAIHLNRSVLCYTVSEEHANELISRIQDLYNWKKVKSIQELYRNDPERYEPIAVHLREFAVENKFNGNYQASLSNGNINYLLDNEGRVYGKELEYGLAVREVNNSFFVDAIFAGMTIGQLSNKTLASQFVEELSQYIILSNRDMVLQATNDITMSRYIQELASNIENGLATPPPPETKFLELKFQLYGGENAEKKKVFVESFKRLNQLVGLKAVKQQMEHLLKTVSANKTLEKVRIQTKKAPMHSLFVGSAGTGKTEVARLFADLLWSIDIIRERKLNELSKEQLTSQYVGGTEEIVSEEVEKSIGGVLFVDEAYMLADNQGSDQTGKKALEIIMRAMENHRDDLVVIFAGYEDEIEQLLDINQGLRSRFVHKFLFEDFNEEELKQVAFTMIRSAGFYPKNIDQEMLQLIKKQKAKGIIPGNARTVRKLVDKVIEQHKIQIVTGRTHLTNITADSIKVVLNGDNQSHSNQTNKEKSEQKLTRLIGLNDLKQEIKNWSNYILIEKKRFDRGLSNQKPTLHMTFEGSPGTGKTTVARIIGEILKHNGLLSRGHFIEASRSDLVGEYMGHTAIKVKKLTDSARGGILFIDEAYALVQDERDNFGREAVDTLIAEMENNRDDLVVILAGYTNEIEKLLEANPGFKSRIANRFNFPDYSAEELYALFELQIKSDNFILEEDATHIVKRFISEKKEQNDVDGNGRWIRNVIDKIKMAQANRLVAENSEELEVIKAADVSNIML